MSEGKAHVDPTKVLIVDYGSKSAMNLKDMYKAHQEKSGIEYKIETITEKKLLNLKKSDPEGAKLKEYDIIHQSGSRVRSLGDEAAQYLMDQSNADNYMIGTCHGAQEIAQYHGVAAKKLDHHQKGKQEIQYKDGETAHIHKAHSWGIPVDSGSGLEAIATSEQKFNDNSKGKIYEVFNVKGTNHIGIQGHGEQGIGKEIMYDVLDQVHEQQYNSKDSQKDK